MELIEVKLCAIITLILGSMFVGLVPTCFSSYGRNNWPLLLSSLLCFGGGVLLATSLVHMLPEIRQNLPDYKEYTELIFCAGFFMLYLIDEMVHYFFGSSHNTHTNHATQHDTQCMQLNQQNTQHTHETQTRHCNTRCYNTLETEPLLQERQHAYNPNFQAIDCAENSNQAASQLCHIGHTEPCQNTPTNCFGLLAALSIHAVLEGLAVGLEDSTSKVLLLFGAIASHKLVVGFCLGVELSNVPENTMFKHFISILIFSSGTPLGIGLGMSISKMPSKIEEYLLPVLQGLAAGTLFYVSVSEVLPRERARWHKDNTRKYAGMCQFISVTSGFIIMTALTKYMEH